MGLLKRLFGICKTLKPGDENCWTYEKGKLTINLPQAPELQNTGDALRFEGCGLPCRVLVFVGENGEFKALKNKCTHMGRRLDPFENNTLQCCSVNKTTFAADGSVISGPGKGPLSFFEVNREDQALIIDI